MHRKCEICGAALDPGEKCDCITVADEAASVPALLCAQPPVIFENLDSVRQNLEAILAEVSAYPADDDSLKKVKQIRADLAKDFDALESQCRAVKRQVMEPYDKAAEKYNVCISDPYKAADQALKKWVDDYQNALKKKCEDGLRAYFDECCRGLGIDFLKFEDCGVVVDMATARQKEPRKAIDRIFDFVTAVRTDIDNIADMDDSAAVFAEYRKCLNLSQAISAYNKRKQAEADANTAIDGIRLRQAQLEQHRAEIMAAAPEIQQERQGTYSVAFLATGTLPALKSMKAHALSMGITLEEIKQEDENDE